MKYQFHVELTEADFAEYRIFMFTKSRQAKRRIRASQLLYGAGALLFLGWQLNMTMRYGQPMDWRMLACTLVLAVMVICTPAYRKWLMKYATSKAGKSSGTLFPPSAVLTFYDDHMEGVLPEGKKEGSYAAIKEIDLNGNRAIYLQAKDRGVFFLPTACFASQQQREGFLAFLQEKCPGAMYGRARK